MTAARCVLDTGARPRPAAAGLVCRAHLEQLDQLLDPAQTGQVFAKPGEPRVAASIPVLWQLLDAAPAVGEKVGGGVFRSTPPGDLRVMAHRDPRSRPAEDDDPWSVLGTLAAIARRLDLRDIDGQPVPLPGRTVEAHAVWLHARLDHLVAAEWVADAWHDLRTVHRQLRAAAGDPANRPVGPCRQIVDKDGHLDPEGDWTCGAPLYLPEQAPKGMDEPVQLPTVRCRSCGWTYTGVELVRLARQKETKTA